MNTPSSRSERRLGAALLASLVFFAVVPSLAATPAPRAPRVDLRALATAKSFDRFIVKFRAGSAAAESVPVLDAALGRAAQRAKEQWGARLRAHGQPEPAQAWKLHGLRRLAIGADVFVASEKLDAARARLLLEQLGADPDVEYVEIDQVLHEDLVPNDSSYAQLWGMQDADAGIRADKAWDLGNGSGVVVAVIDTGYTDHSDLVANVLPGYDFVADVTRSNDGDGRDADAHDPGNFTDTSASNWHGSHVAGTIAAIGNNAKGVIGAAYGAKILPVRVLGAGGGDGSDIVDGIVWASGGTVPGVPNNPNPAEVLNLSLGGGGGCSASYQTAIDGAVSRGTLVVVAAGNESQDANTGSLSTCNNVVVVGAHTSSAARSSFSNYGAAVDVTGPGSSVYSTINTGTTVPVAESYANYQGTSMATPHVAAAAALTQAYRVAKGQAPYTPTQLEAQLKATGYPLVQGCYAASGPVVDARTLLDTADGAFKLLADGVAQGSQSASTGNGLRFAMPNTWKAQGLSFSTSGGTGNADLYVKYGSAPTTSSFDCSSTTAGNNESCTIPSAQPGTYYVLLQAASGYSNVSITGAAAGNLKPLVDFSVAATGLTANFTDASSDADGGVATRKWVFGDNTSSTTTSPQHVYNLAGGYSVQLTSTDGAGASNCALKQLNVNPPNTVLFNNGPVTNIAANIGGQLPYSLAVPAGASNLHFDTSGGSGDADLYVKFGSPPTLSDFDCVSGSPTTTESCVLPNATAGTWYVLVHAYSNISGVSLVGSYDGGGGSNTPPVANFSFTTNNLTATFTDASSDSDGIITAHAWDFGDGSTSTSTNASHTYASGGTYTVTLTVTDNGGASTPISKQVTVAPPPVVNVSIGDAAIDEGNSSSRTLAFTVLLSGPTTVPVKFTAATADGTAIAPTDYTAKTQSMSIPAGTTSKNFTVAVKGDLAAEPDESFFVNLSGVTGGIVTDGQAVGTIRNDDGAAGTATMTIANLTQVEGNSGTSQFVFTVQLSQAIANNVSFNVATADGTARAGTDYVALNLAGQVIPAGQTSKTVSITVNGDTTVETNERFKVNLSSVVGATVLDAQAIGIIQNDD